MSNVSRHIASRRHNACDSPLSVTAVLLIAGMAWVGAVGAKEKSTSDPYLPSELAIDDSDSWQELNAARLDEIRGRHVSAAGLELDERLEVILWDESQGGHSTSGSNRHQSQHGNNQQHQSMRTKSYVQRAPGERHAN